MSDKTNAIRCLAISIVGWLVLVGGFVYMENAPVENDWSSLINFAIFLRIVIVASVIQLISVVFAILLLLTKNRYIKLCVTTLLSFIVFVFFVIAWWQGWILI